MNFFNEHYYYDDFSEHESQNTGYFSGIKSWWNNSKKAWEIAKKISPIAFVLSILIPIFGLFTSTLSLLFVEPVLKMFKEGGIEHIVNTYTTHLCVLVILFMLFTWIKPYVLLYLQKSFKDLKIRQELFIKDVLLYIPYIFSIDSTKKYTVRRFSNFVENIFSITKEQAKMIVSLCTIIIGFSIGSQMDIVFLLFMVISTVFSIYVDNKQTIENFRHRNNQEESLLFERKDTLGGALKFPSLSTHLANQLNVIRDMFTISCSETIDRELLRKRTQLLAERKNSLFDTVMKLCVFGYIFYNIKQGKMLDVFAIYYVANRVCGSIHSFGRYLVGQNETSEKLSFVHQIIDLSNTERVSEESKLYPDISNGIELSIQNISFKYPNDDKYIFKNFSIDLTLDKLFGLQGKNGNGKTTLFKLITGYLLTNSGKILINGVNVKDIQRKWFSDTFANYDTKMYVLDYLTVAEFLTIDKCDKTKNYLPLMHQVLTDVGLDEKFQNKDITKIVLNPGHPNGTDLSAGQEQRLLIARMLMNAALGAKYVLSDEMSPNIDIQGRIQIFSTMKKYVSKGIVISHDIDSIESCDEILLCKNHRVIKEKVSQPILSC